MSYWCSTDFQKLHHHSSFLPLMKAFHYIVSEKRLTDLICFTVFTILVYVICKSTEIYSEGRSEQ